MSAPEKGGKRRYRDLSLVILALPIKCPKRNATYDNFPAAQFAFFVEDGWFCIEVKDTGAVVELPPAQVRAAFRKTEAELEAERKAAKLAVEAAPVTVAEATA